MLVNNFLEHSAARLPKKTALICEQQVVTYSELDARANRIAVALASMGVTRQDRVIILLENSIESVIALFGILKAGAVFVMLNPGMKAGKLNFILKDSGAKGIVTHVSKAPLLQDAAADANDLQHIIWCGEVPEHVFIPENPHDNVKNSCFWDSLIAPEREPDLTKLPRVIDVDLATIIYTSGSTGEPKGVVSTHFNVVAAARSITTYLENVENDIILSALPLSFDYGLYQVLMASLFGGTVVIEKSFVFPYKVMEQVVANKVTGFPIVPTMAALLLQMENLVKIDCSSLRYITNTAAALPESYIRRLQGLFPHVMIYSMYGLTECKRVAYLPPEELERRTGSVGVPIPNEEVFIFDEQGNEVGPWEIGELVVRGSNVMQGYWNRTEETAATFRPGRYRGEALLYTGDLFKKDEEGFLYFVGRKDDMIKSKGERISPREIENTLCAMSGVAEAAVIGVPDEILGHAIKAFIVPDGKSPVTSEQVMRYCAQNLESFMVPKYVEFRTEFPKSPSGKVDKKVLKAAERVEPQGEDLSISSLVVPGAEGETGIGADARPKPT